MKRLFATGLLVGAFGLAVSVGAQTPTGEQAATGKQQSVTITGCLSEATGAQGEFLLSKMPASATTSGTEASTFRLIGGGKVNLKEHVGHKVQVTGKMAGEQGRGSGDQPAASGQGSPTEPKLNVTALKHIATTCDTAK